MDGRGAREVVTLAAEGMDCPSCARTARRRLLEFGGVHSVDPDIIAQRVTVTVDPASADPEDLRRALDALGYGDASAPRAQETAHDARGRGRGAAAQAPSPARGPRGGFLAAHDCRDAGLAPARNGRAPRHRDGRRHGLAHPSARLRRGSPRVAGHARAHVRSRRSARS